MVRVIVTSMIVIALVACGDDGQDQTGDADVAGVDVPDGFAVTEVVSGLVGPTQLTLLDDGSFLVAQLNGAEDEGVGQVLRIDPARSGEPTVLFDGLLTPTGVTVADGEVWVMEQRRLSRGPLDGGPLTTVLDELPFNGRSEGTLTTDDEGRVLYDTSGTLRDGAVAPGSATLWAVTAATDPAPLATGFKHAYARTFAADGTLWQTEVSDGSYDGEPAPDELVAVEGGADFGWPQCIGDRTVVEEYGGTTERCAATPRSQALFPPGATPTSVAVAPWDQGELLVALWNAGEVVTAAVGGEAPVEPTTFLTGLVHPQHLVADGDRLLVVDFDGGRILAVTAT